MTEQEFEPNEVALKLMQDARTAFGLDSHYSEVIARAASAIIAQHVRHGNREASRREDYGI